MPVAWPRGPGVGSAHILSPWALGRYQFLGNTYLVLNLVPVGATTSLMGSPPSVSSWLT